MIKCIVVDDEALARRLLKDHIGKIPDLELIATCESPFQARAEMTKQEVDLMFLDIRMPEITGIDFLKMLKKKPLTVFVTAYPDYALQGYELDVIDYLLKPVSFERFYQAVNKAIDYLSYKTAPKPNLVIKEVEDLYENGFFYVKADFQIVRIDFREILFVEGMKEYVQIHTENRKVMTHITMLKMCEILPSDAFMRVHKSYIINLQKIDRIQGNQLFIRGKQVFVSKSNRNDLLERINKLLIH
jgi:two-component system, LytTR family, response regulator